MVKMKAEYAGGLHCNLVHGPSNSLLETDAPKDNQGKGERFSPTDLVGAAFASCILTTMAIVAERDGISITGARAETEKEMVPDPRRIGSLHTKIWMPPGIPEAARKKLEHAANHCPVHKSLAADLGRKIDFVWG
jgi:putative redox protein